MNGTKQAETCMVCGNTYEKEPWRNPKDICHQCQVDALNELERSSEVPRNP